MKKLLLSITILGSLLISTTGFATTSATVVTKIIGMGFYNGFGPGLVHFEVEHPATGCAGFYMDSNDDGYQSSLSALLAAYHAQTQITATGLTTVTTTALGGGTYCKLYFISYE